MKDLSRYVELYRQTTEHDTEVLWSKVNIIREAIADGADVPTLLAECGKESGDSAKQVKKFYAVAMVFRANEVIPDFDYWTHEACATAPGVDLEDRQTYVIAHQWMVTAGHREIKRGKKTIHAKHTARTLKAAIRAANGDGKPKPETVYKGEAIFKKPTAFDGRVTIPLELPYRALLEQLTALQLRVGETVTVTITRVVEAPNEQEQKIA